MRGRLEELQRIARGLLAPEDRIDLIRRAESLRDLLEAADGFASARQETAPAGTRLASGLAISPRYAALCVRELGRTPAFIRGLAQAIADASRTDRPVHVLYAGCGPYAALALPLMSLLAAGEARFTLLDIHQASLDRALALIGAFGVGDRVEAAVCADATCYRIPSERIPHVIVSETMAVCLHNEPQVSIARNLLPQAPAARMVPHSVSVDLCALDPAREHRLAPADHVGEIAEPERDRIELGRVFELDAASIHAWGLAQERLPAARVQLPALGPRHRLSLLTRIRVYGDIRLEDYECSLTLPQPLRGQQRLAGGEALQFHYELGPHPRLVWEIAAG